MDHRKKRQPNLYDQHRACRKQLPAQKHGPWSESEDQRLLGYIGGTPDKDINWTSISDSMQNRSSKQCRERYHQNLKPGLNHSRITPQEGEYIMNRVRQDGKCWSKIAKDLEGRSDNCIKNWHNGQIHRIKKEARTQEKHAAQLAETEGHEQLGRRYHGQEHRGQEPYGYGQPRYDPPTRRHHGQERYGSPHHEQELPGRHHYGQDSLGRRYSKLAHTRRQDNGPDYLGYANYRYDHDLQHSPTGQNGAAAAWPHALRMSTQEENYQLSPHSGVRDTKLHPDHTVPRLPPLLNLGHHHPAPEYSEAPRSFERQLPFPDYRGARLSRPSPEAPRSYFVVSPSQRPNTHLPTPPPLLEPDPYKSPFPAPQNAGSQPFGEPGRQPTTSRPDQDRSRSYSLALRPARNPEPRPATAFSQHVLYENAHLDERRHHGEPSNSSS